MKRLRFLPSLPFLILSFCAGTVLGGDRPNILWITAEDLSPALGCYGDPDARTPHLDALAKESVRYTSAFAPAPVCSPVRSSIITGVSAASLGTSQMRSDFPIPADVHGFPSYLRKAGYFTTNQVKTDYNTSDEARLIQESWDEISPEALWSSEKRKADQPFFSVVNFMTTHQSRLMVWPYEVFQREIQSKLPPELIHDPAQVTVPPYYPDTPVVRRELARFHDCVSLLDIEVGALLKKLADDGLAEETIVFFYGDHGSGIPRHKRTLLDSGMRVPLLIRFPKKYRSLAPAAPGETSDRLVNFLDFAPTLMEFTGSTRPDFLQGKVMFGPKTEPEPEFLYGFRDRIDEAFDTARSVRSHQYLYIRNYLPDLSWAQPSVFSDLGAIQQEIVKYATEHADSLTPAQKAYVGQRSVEEFYDLTADPENLHNLLAEKSELSEPQKNALESHRAAFQSQRIAIGDVGLLPESVMHQWISEEGRPIREITEGKTNHHPDLIALWNAADLVGSQDRVKLLKNLHDWEPPVRYWAVVALHHAFPNDPAILEALFDSMDDIEPSVRIESAAWMAQVSEVHRDEALAVLGRELESEDWWTALRACRAVELLGETAKPLLPTMEMLYAQNRFADGDAALFLSFSSGAFLEKMGKRTTPWDFSPKK